MNKHLIDYSLIDELWGSSPVERLTYEELLAYVEEAKAEEPDWRPDQTAEEIASIAYRTMEDYLELNNI
ncbi:MAG: hypothetical protein WC057_08950 [Dehalococcoidales bacterium]